MVPKPREMLLLKWSPLSSISPLHLHLNSGSSETSTLKANSMSQALGKQAQEWRVSYVCRCTLNGFLGFLNPKNRAPAASLSSTSPSPSKSSSLCFLKMVPVKFGDITIESIRLEGTLNSHLLQYPCNEQGGVYLQINWVSQGPIKLTFSFSRDGATTTSLGNLFQYFTTHIV